MKYINIRHSEEIHSELSHSSSLLDLSWKENKYLKLNRKLANMDYYIHAADLSQWLVYIGV